jgi:alpha-glucosidase
MKTPLQALIAGIFLFHTLSAQDSTPIQLQSPGKVLELNISLQQSRITWTVVQSGKTRLEGADQGLVLQSGDTVVHYQLITWDTTSVYETWAPIYGTTAVIENKYKHLNLHLKSQSPPFAVNLEFRLYDEGLAYRMHVNGPQDTALRIASERGTIRLPPSIKNAHWIWADYHTLEKLVQHTPLVDAKHAAAPFTLEDSSGLCISLLEAALANYSMCSWKQDSLDFHRYNVHLTPSDKGYAVQSTFPMQTPWRVIAVAENAARLMESNLVLNLNEPAPILDWSWVKPIRYIGIWWEMHLGLSEWKTQGLRHGATTANVKKYVDFAAQHGIEGVLIEGWNSGWEYWGKPGAFDFVTSASDLVLEEVVNYARSKGVEIIGHHETGGDIVDYERKIDTAFAYYKALGIRYVKTGYAGPVNPPTETHHGQYMVDHMNKVMRIAAKYHIMLDVHEAVIPSGLSRTWPNLMTFEAVRGMEWNAWSEGNPPDHACSLPFTRGLAGPVDYTPGIFDIQLKYRENERVKWNGKGKGETAVHTTLSHQLALPVVLYSPMQMFADLPENYLRHPQAFAMMAEIPATWDETRVLSAEIGKHIVLARRKGKKWFLAAIASEPIHTELELGFLDKEYRYRVQQCNDDPTANAETNPLDYRLSTTTARKQDKVRVNLVPGGGLLWIFNPTL